MAKEKKRRMDEVGKEVGEMHVKEKGIDDGSVGCKED